MRSHLLSGTVRHRRVRPKAYELEHGVFYIALDLDELEQVAAGFRLLGRNRWNVLSLRDADYQVPHASDLREGLHARLRAEGVDPTGWRTTLVTSPRVFGYQFNPASFYLCRDPADDLRIVIVEVHNTYGERRLYTLRPRATPAAHVAEMDKDFYVSPFISMDAHYTVRVQDRPDDLRIVIDQTEAGEPILQASVNVRRQPLTDGTLLRMLVRYPFVTQKTIVMIHWHALRLWLKGITFHPRGDQPAAAQIERQGEMGR